MKLLFLLAVLATSGALTYAVLVYARRRQLLDIPNARSSHSTPVPRGGGLAVVVTVTIASIAASAVGWTGNVPGMTLLGASLAIAALGFVDDHRDIPAAWRFVAQVLVAIVIAAAAGGFGSIAFGDYVWQTGVPGMALAVAWIVWTTNAFNFMDGIDGIAGIEAISVSVTLLVCATATGHPQFAFGMAIVAASSLGFLLFNWPPARIFMGDVGSCFLGFLFGSLALVSHQQGIASIWVWLIALGVFMVDACITLAARILAGEKWYEAHRSHAYQVASRLRDSHFQVTAAVAVINLCWLLPLAWLVATGRLSGLAGLAVAYLPLALLVLFVRGRAEPSGGHGGIAGDS